MDLSQYINLFRRKLWLLVLAGALTGAVAYLVIGRQPVEYEARVLISVGGYIESPDPDATDIRSGIDLAQTYAVIATTNDVLQSAIDTISFPALPEQIRDGVEADVLPETSILEIKVTYTDPSLAAGLANQIAQQLITISPTDPRLALSGRRPVQSNYLKVVQWATAPNTPSSLPPVVAVILGTIVGVVISAGGLVLIEYLDHTVRLPEEAKLLMGYPVLGMIPNLMGASKQDPQALIRFVEPGNMVSERFRALRAFLLYDDRHLTNNTFIITSPSPGDGKSFTASNLAITMAAGEKRVLLVDADLRMPVLHEIFGLPNELGLTNLLSLEPPVLSQSNHTSPDTVNLDQYLQKTEYPNLKLLTSGPVSVSPTELMGSKLMEKWFHALSRISNFDIIIFDTPPILAASDSYVLAMTIESPLILVLRSGKTLHAEALELKEIATRLNLDVKGVVLNGIKIQELMPYYRKAAAYYYHAGVNIGKRQSFTSGLLQSIDRLRHRFEKKTSDIPGYIPQQPFKAEGEQSNGLNDQRFNQEDMTKAH